MFLVVEHHFEGNDNGPKDSVNGSSGARVRWRKKFHTWRGHRTRTPLSRYWRWRFCQRSWPPIRRRWQQWQREQGHNKDDNGFEDFLKWNWLLWVLRILIFEIGFLHYWLLVGGIGFWIASLNGFGSNSWQRDGGERAFFLFTLILFLRLCLILNFPIQDCVYVITEGHASDSHTTVTNLFSTLIKFLMTYCSIIKLTYNSCRYRSIIVLQLPLNIKHRAYQAIDKQQSNQKKHRIVAIIKWKII